MQILGTEGLPEEWREVTVVIRAEDGQERKGGEGSCCQRTRLMQMQEGSSPWEQEDPACAHSIAAYLGAGLYAPQAKEPRSSFQRAMPRRV